MTTIPTGEPLPDVADLGTTVREIVGKLPGPLRRIMVQVNGCVVEVEWNGDSAGFVGAPAAVAAAASTAVPAAAEPDSVPSVTATVVGCFYRRASPDAAPFVEIGDVIEVGAQIGLIETMKLFTPVTSDLAGRVVAIHAEDGDMVEFGQRLVDVALAD